MRFMYRSEADYGVIPALLESQTIRNGSMDEGGPGYAITVYEDACSVIVWGVNCVLGWSLLLDELRSSYYTDCVRSDLKSRISNRPTKQPEKTLATLMARVAVPLLAHNGSKYDVPLLFNDIFMNITNPLGAHIPMPVNHIVRGTSHLAARWMCGNARRPMTADELLARQEGDKSTWICDGDGLVGYMFRDSCRFLTASLDRLGKEYECTVVKGIFPYTWLYSFNQLYHSYRLVHDDPLPSVAEVEDLERPPCRFDFSSGSGENPLTGYPCLSVEEWYDFIDKETDEEGYYSPKDHIEHYLLADIALLSEVWSKFRSGQIKDYGVDPFSCLSSPSLAHKIFMKGKNKRTIKLCSYITNACYEQIKGAKMGGHTEAMQRFATTNPHLLEKYGLSDDFLYKYIDGVDVNSLYPSVMCVAHMPVGEPTLYNKPTELEVIMQMLKPDQVIPPRFTNNPDDHASAFSFAPPSNTYGYMMVDITMPDDVMYSPLGERVIDPVDGFQRLEFNLLSKNKMVIFSEELKSAIAYYGCRVTRVHWFLEFKHSDQVFSDFVTTHYKQRLEERAAGNNIKANEKKLLMNSLFGKMLQDTELFREIFFVKSADELDKLMADPTTRVLRCDTLRCGEVARITTKKLGPLKKSELYLTTMAPVGMAILSYARTVMAIMIADLQKACPNITYLYTDTDSFYYALKSEADFLALKPTLSKYLGNRLMESKYEYDQGSINGYAAIGPKTYTLLLDNNTSNNPPDYYPPLSELAPKFKMKGIRQSLNADLICFDAYMQQLLDKESEPLIGRQFAIVQRAPLQLYSLNNPKKLLDKHYRKRAWLPEDPLRTYPKGHKVLLQRQIEEAALAAVSMIDSDSDSDNDEQVYMSIDALLN